MTGSRLDELRKFVEQDPTDPFGYYAVALEYVSTGKFAEAVRAFEDLIAFDPEYVPAYHQLGLLFVRLDRPVDARTTLGRGIQAAERLGDTHAKAEMQETIDELVA